MFSLFFFILLTFSLSPLTTILSLALATAATPPHSALIQKTCNTTSYYDLCVSSLDSDPRSPSADDAAALSAIAVAVAAANATDTAVFLSRSAASSSAEVRDLLSACAARYGDAHGALAASMDALTAEEYDYAFVHVSAAAEYPNVCRALFQHRKKVAYPPELRRREVALERLCTVALEIISLLG